jgi:hypothetical protein
MRILTAAFAAAMDFLPFSLGAAADKAKASEIGARQNAGATSNELFVAKRRGVRSSPLFGTCMHLDVPGSKANSASFCPIL